jgi:hypothetical protein
LRNSPGHDCLHLYIQISDRVEVRGEDVHVPTGVIRTVPCASNPAEPVVRYG